MLPDAQEHKVVFTQYASATLRGAEAAGFVDLAELLAIKVPFTNKRIPSVGEYVCAI